MLPLTVGDIRPLFDFVSSFPLLDDNAGIASQIRSLYTSRNLPVTPELDAAFTQIENEPLLVGLGVEEFRAAVDGLSDDTLLSDIEAFGIDTGSGGGTGGGTVTLTPTTDEDGNLVQTFTLPFTGTTISVAESGVTITTPEGVQRIDVVDRLNFSDGTLYLDTDAEPGSVYQAYQALFGRAPDRDGFEFWVDTLENGGFDEFDLARSFVETSQFDDLYGSLLDNSDGLVSAFYQNIFGRAADQAGLDYWSDIIDASGGGGAVADTIGHFLSSDELDSVLEETFGNGVFV